MFTQLKENVLILLVEVHVCRLLGLTARSIYTFCLSYRVSDRIGVFWEIHLHYISVYIIALNLVGWH